MAESILTDLWLQNGELSAYNPRSVVLPAATWTLIAAPDPQRFSITVERSNFSDPVVYSTLGTAVVGVFAGQTPTVPDQIHASVYPLLIGGTWYAYSVAGQTVTVIETVRMKRG